MAAKMNSFKVETAAEFLNDDCLRRARDLHEVLFAVRPTSPKRLGAAADARRAVTRAVEEVRLNLQRGSCICVHLCCLVQGQDWNRKRGREQSSEDRASSKLSNVKCFECKVRYASWCCGGHCVRSLRVAGVWSHGQGLP